MLPNAMKPDSRIHRETKHLAVTYGGSFHFDQIVMYLYQIVAIYIVK